MSTKDDANPAPCGCPVGGLHFYACPGVGHVDPPRSTAPDDATRDALAEDRETYVLTLAPHLADACEMLGIEDADMSDGRGLADTVYCLGYLPPGQADALRAEVDQAKARLRAVQAVLAEWGASDQPVAEDFAEAVQDSGAWRLLRDLRAALAPGAPCTCHGPDRPPGTDVRSTPVRSSPPVPQTPG